MTQPAPKYSARNACVIRPPLRPGRLFQWPVLLAWWLSPLAAAAPAACFVHATSVYEKAYCQIKEEAPATALPAFDDFRRNDAGIQYLLLKRHATRLKIALDPPQVSPRTPPAASAADAPAAKGISAPAAPANPAPTAATLDSRLKDCSLKANRIDCTSGQYLLQENRANHRLVPEHLQDDRPMALQDYTGPANDAYAKGDYLTRNYGRYLEKMLDIGLGAATLSYTRFCQIHDELSARNMSFAERFETMYLLLKKDKRTLTVAARYSETLPHTLSQCDTVTPRLIVCDTGSANWVYQR